MLHNFIIIIFINLFVLQLWDAQGQLFSDRVEDLFLYRGFSLLDRGSTGEREEIQ